MALNLGGIFNQSSSLAPGESGGIPGSNTVFDLLNPSKARSAISGLLPGGASSLSKAIQHWVPRCISYWWCYCCL